MPALQRVFLGLTAGEPDVEMSCEGFDARTADKSNPKEMFFSAFRAGNGLVREVGTIPTSEQWVNFTGTYSDIPEVLVVNRRGDTLLHQPWDYSSLYTELAGTLNRVGTLYVPVVEINRIMISKPALGGANLTSLANDSFLFFVVG